MMVLQAGEKLDCGPHGFLHSQVCSLQLSHPDGALSGKMAMQSITTGIGQSILPAIRSFGDQRCKATGSPISLGVNCMPTFPLCSRNHPAPAYPTPSCSLWNRHEQLSNSCALDLDGRIR